MPATAQTEPLPAEAPAQAQPSAAHTSAFWTLTLGTLGVVYGDIGTSPLYALKESLSAAAAGGALTREMVFGVVSLILWALIVIVTMKYVLLILRADNNGEGGTLTLMALPSAPWAKRAVIVLLGMVGRGAVLWRRDHHAGDLGALGGRGPEARHAGLRALRPASQPRDPGRPLRGAEPRHGARGGLVRPDHGRLVRAHGARRLRHIADDPSILAAISPTYGCRFLVHHGMAACWRSGPCSWPSPAPRRSMPTWAISAAARSRPPGSGLVLPSLALNYIGQGALLLRHPSKLENPFFLLYPDWALLPMVGMATLATIIASQAVITGAFSLTQQAIQLGLLPRMEIRWTSETEKGQIYVPRVNWLLLVAVLFLVITFKSSSALATPTASPSPARWWSRP